MRSCRPAILILDDDKDILELLEIVLKNKYELTLLDSCAALDEVLFEQKYDLLIIDRTLPNGEGVELVKRLRQNGVKTPVIFLTAKNSQKDKLEGFSSGGDDYITKPFDIDEVVARVDAVIRRTRKSGLENRLVYKSIEMDLDSFTVKVDGKDMILTSLEFRLLKTFLENQDRVLDRDFLLKAVWKCGILNDNCNEKTVNMAIKRLKEKIGKEKIIAIRGIGYRLW